MSHASHARHRAHGPARSLFTDLSSSVSDTARRGVVVGASSTLLISLVATGAYAQSAQPATAPAALDAVAPEAPAAPTVTPEVVVPADATSTVVSLSATATAAPEPEAAAPAVAVPSVGAPAGETTAGETTAGEAPIAEVHTPATVPETSVAAAPAAPTEPAAPAAPAEPAAPTAPTAPAEPAAQQPATTGGVVDIARGQVGSAYVWGSARPGAFDCSGLTSWAYRQVGIDLPHQSGAQRAHARAHGTKVPAAAAQPGDLMWWPGHVAIYVGNGMMIDAGSRATGVSERRVYGSPEYYRLG